MWGNSRRTTGDVRPWAPRRSVAALALLMGPFVVLSVVLKSSRIAALPDPHPAWPLLIASDLLFSLGWTLLWVGALLLVGRSWLRHPIFLVAQVGTLMLAAVTLAHHLVTVRTGSVMAWERAVAVLSSLDQFQGLLLAEVSLNRLVGAAVVLAVVFGLLPWALWIGSPRQPTRRGGLARRLLAPTVAIVMLLASGLAPASASSRFARAPLPSMLLSPGEERRALADYEGEVGRPAAAPTDLVSAGSPAPRNVVTIVLESQRATATLPETSEPVTPVLDELARTSITAERGYAVVPHTSKSLVGIHCGVEPPLDVHNSEADPGVIDGPCLPELLGARGYRSAFFQSATEHFERRRDLVREFGFDDFIPNDEIDPDGEHTVNYFGSADEVMLEPSRKWVQARAGTPFALTYLTVTGHHDYNAPADHPHVQYVEGDEQFNDYLNALHYQDQFVGRVIAQFKDLGLYEDTIFVVVGDHGEAFGEHGARQHDNAIHDEGIQVPLMIHDPQHRPVAVPGPVQQLSILPTVADLMGYSLSGGTPRGRSMLADRDDDEVLVTSCFERGRCAAALDGNLKYIHHFGDRPDEVFDLSVDPYERDDIAALMEPSWLEAHRQRVVQWRAGRE